MSASIFCPYCRQHTAISPPLLRLTNPPTDHNLNTVSHAVGYYEPRRGPQKWWLMVCNNCHEPVLYEQLTKKVIPTPGPQPTPEQIPQPMQADLIEAKKCLADGCYTAAAIMARRVIQAACLEHNAPKGTLEKQMEWMLAQGHILRRQKEWADSVRGLGNVGAHPGEDEFTDMDARLDEATVNAAVHVAEQLMVALYVTNARAQEVLAVVAAKKGKKA